MSWSIDIVGNRASWIKVSYTGVYNFEKFYRDLINWFKANGYFFHEKAHIEVVRPAGKDYKIDFDASKEVDDYAKYSIKVEIWALRTSKLGKENLNKGEIQVRIKGSMEVDYKNQFEKYGAVGKVMRSFYHKYIIKKRLWTKYAADVYVDTNNLITSVKSNLGLITQY